MDVIGEAKTLCNTCTRANGECQEYPVVTRDCPRYDMTDVNMYLHPDAPCKKCHDMDEIDCRYCYCPLYHMDCGGNFTIMAAGVKDCSDCTIPHQPGFDPGRIAKCLP